MGIHIIIYILRFSGRHEISQFFCFSVAFGNPPKVTDVVQDVIMSSGVFWQYPYYLPEHGLCKFINR